MTLRFDKAKIFQHAVKLLLGLLSTFLLGTTADLFLSSSARQEALEFQHRMLAELGDFTPFSLVEGVKLGFEQAVLNKPDFQSVYGSLLFYSIAGTWLSLKKIGSMSVLSGIAMGSILVCDLAFIALMVKENIRNRRLQYKKLWRENFGSDWTPAHFHGLDFKKRKERALQSTRIKYEVNKRVGSYNSLFYGALVFGVGAFAAGAVALSVLLYVLQQFAIFSLYAFGWLTDFAAMCSTAFSLLGIGYWAVFKIGEKKIDQYAERIIERKIRMNE